MHGETIESRGRSTEDAIRQALEQLGVGRDEVEVEVLAEGRTGVFGIAAQEARVRVTVTGGEYDEGEEEEALYGGPPTRISSEDADVARETLERMLDLLEFPNVVSVREIDTEKEVTLITLDVAGEDVGLIIGRRGETLANLQFLLNACLSGQIPRNTRVIVDVEHYRDRREQSLRGIALRTADRVQRERRAITLQPMPANERRVIHLALQSSPYVSTESTGEGIERRVVIAPKPGAPPPRRSPYPPRRPAPGRAQPFGRFRDEFGG